MDIKDVMDQLNDLMLKTQLDMDSQGYDKEFTSDFICLRYHISHTWGVGFVHLDGHKIPCVVRLSDEKPNHVKIVLVGYHPAMKLLDLFGKEIPLDGHAKFDLADGEDRTIN